jgi:hypothetical protein
MKIFSLEILFQIILKNSEHDSEFGFLFTNDEQLTLLYSERTITIGSLILLIFMIIFLIFSKLCEFY